MTEIKVSFVDDNECTEMFADSPRVVAWVADNVLHAELRALRREIPDTGGGKETATERPVSRVAMSIPTAIALQATLAHHLGELEKQGLLKRMEPPHPSAPKH
jgi:hypothetical protein